jgi:hypothetical protein
MKKPGSSYSTENDSMKWEQEDFDIDYNVIRKFIEKMKGFEFNLRFWIDEEMKVNAEKYSESLRPWTKEKLWAAMNSHIEAEKDCVSHLDRLKKTLRKIVCLSPELHTKLVISKNLISSTESGILLNIRMFEQFVTWYNQYQQHCVTSLKLNDLISTFEPEIKPDLSIKVHIGEEQNIFVSLGAGWKIRFQGGKVSIVPHTNGMIFIHSLLREPAKPIGIGELFSASKESSSVNHIDDEDEEAISNVPGAAIKSLDRKAYNELMRKRNYLRNRIKEIKLENSSENFEELDLAENELEKIEKQLMKNKHFIGSSLKKPSDNVRKQVNLSITQIKRYDLQMAEFLESHIKIGYKSIYLPPDKESIDWILD